MFSSRWTRLDLDVGCRVQRQRATACASAPPAACGAPSVWRGLARVLQALSVPSRIDRRGSRCVAVMVMSPSRGNGQHEDHAVGRRAVTISRCQPTRAAFDASAEHGPALDPVGLGLARITHAGQTGSPLSSRGNSATSRSRSRSWISCLPCEITSRRAVSCETLGSRPIRLSCGVRRVRGTRDGPRARRSSCAIVGALGGRTIREESPDVRCVALDRGAEPTELLAGVQRREFARLDPVFQASLSAHRDAPVEGNWSARCVFSGWLFVRGGTYR